MIASVESAEATIAPSVRRQASNSAASAWAVENCVPLISASPSLARSATGSSPTAASASAPGSERPSTLASPSPIITALMWASGARSPDAPTEPCAGTSGTTPRASMPSSNSTSDQRTPEAPRPNEASLSAIIRRTIGAGVGSPTPAEWERTRFRCSVATSAGATRTEASLPKPVLMP